MRIPLLLTVALGVAGSACSSADFSVPTDAGDNDTASVLDTGVMVDGAGDSGAGLDANSDGASEGGVVEVGPPCAPGPSNPATVYVDKRSTRPPNGTTECPFLAIKDAIALVAALPSGSGAHTLRVSGGTTDTPLVYDEPMLVLKFGWTLLGDGASRVTITGGGTCGDASCLVVAEGGAVIDSVTIDVKGKKVIPLALTPGAFTGTVVRASTITGIKDNSIPGVYVDGLGNADLGPDVRVVDNAGAGILVKNVFRLKLNGTSGSPNVISRNGLGISLLGGVLELGSATEVSKNLLHGISITSPDKATHLIDGLTARENGLSGVSVAAGASVKMRRSKLLKNKVGLTFKSAPGTELDLGRNLDPGKNVFGGKLETNATAGICFPVARLVDVPTWDDQFAQCPPSGGTLDSSSDCDALGGGYKDLAYVGAKPPFDVQNCTVGP